MLLTDQQKLQKIEILISQFSQIDGSHHKNWVFDQVMRVIKGENYQKWVTEYKDGEDGPNTYDWDEGIAP